MTVTLREQQEQHELEQVRLGGMKYRAECLPWQSSGERAIEESATQPGKMLVRQYIAPLATAIEIFMQSCADGEAGRKHAAYPYLLHVLPEQAAYLALRVTINGAAARKKVATVAEEVAQAIEDHINFERMRAENAGLYKLTLEHLLRYREPRRRREVMSRQMKKYALDKLQWTVQERVLLGSKLIELVEVCTGLVKVSMYTEGRHKRRNRVEFSPEVEEWAHDAHEKMALLCPIHMPMLVPPKPWTSPTEGGYLTGAIRSWLVRVKKKEELTEYEGVDMPAVYDAINRVQSTGWRINRSILRLLDEALRNNDVIGGLPDTEDAPMPTRPQWLTEERDIERLELDEAEEFKTWKARAAKVHAENARRRCDRINLKRKFHIASEVVDREAFYLPHYLDFRSRVYPFCDALSPQGDDLTKSLLEFAEGKPLGETGGYWLAVHLANTFALDGIDKAPLDARVEWVKAHEREILDSAFNPLDGVRFWTQAESPWCALAACFEWAGFLVQGDEYVSHLPVNMDGSCSGLQHYSAMLRDPIGGAAVNLVPCEKPADIYTQVAERAQAVVDASEDERFAPWKGGKVIRKIAKQPTMTMCYAATKFGMREQIENALRKLDEDHGGVYLEGADNFKAAVAMADAVWDAIGEVVVAARAGMDFLKACATVATKAGLPVRWTAPSGFVVSQAYAVIVGTKVDVHYNGRAMQVYLDVDGAKIDARKQGLSVAPNVVHSFDSSHLMATVNAGAERGITSWNVIHDSFGCHASDVALLNDIIRETFIEQYSVDRLAKFRAELHEAVASVDPKLADKLPEVPPMGTLDLDAVKRSDFFFA